MSASCCGESLAALSISAVLAVSCPVALPVFGALLVSLLGYLVGSAFRDLGGLFVVRCPFRLGDAGVLLRRPVLARVARGYRGCLGGTVGCRFAGGLRRVGRGSGGIGVFRRLGAGALRGGGVKSANSFCQSSWPSFSRAAQASRPWLRTSPSTTSCLARSRVVAATSRLASLASGLPWGELMLKSASFSAALSSSSWVPWTGPGDSRWRG